MEAMLSSQEVAVLYNRNERTIRRWAESEKLKAEKVYNELNSPEYVFPISTLDEPIQKKYFEQHKLKGVDKVLPSRKASSPLDIFSEAERLEISWWIQLVEEWQGYRAKAKGSKAKVDQEFITLYRLKYPEKQFSIDTLYRRWKAVRECDYDSLVDMRGKARKGKSSIDEMLWQAFLSFYLDENQHPVKRCYEYTQLWAQEDFPHLLPMPSYSTFWRHIQQDIPEAIEVLGREGEKAFRDRCAPYIRRTYEEMASNEWWIADNHTFDIITMGKNGQRHRLYLTAFFDARSGIFTGCYVTTAPSSQSTLIALRKGILKYGIPDNIYVDNGREFLTFDVGGLGHRKKKPKDGEESFTPPPVFERLGIKMTNAIVRNAKAKIIERRFRDVKDQLSRLFETFTGGNVLEKPEKLKGVLKNGAIPMDSTLIEVVEQILEGYFNESEYGGEVVSDRGKPRMQVWQEQLHKKRMAPAEELNLMLMRSSRPQKVTRRGVHLDIAGTRIDYWNDDMLMNLLGRQVYFRYDPDDLSEVRIYDLEDRYIMSVPADNTAVLKYGASKDEVKEAMGKVRRMEKVTKEALKVSALPAFGKRTALELVMASAHEGKLARLAAPENPARVVELQRAIEEPLLQAVGENRPNLARMTKNAMERNGGNSDE